ncbi:hypothetical protein BC937DRAFT_92205 [Endogone sp. FLAS-F59071]|nr:hypothetical protein BC937DRAFT_92205 [Endogone sp. FLAS-F59071]|eukprot:RUS23116.1 hypothetical protein BC937DRAFT_92205 [Endogone sp. FLAS-F59071]
MATEAERQLEFLLRHYTANRILSEPDDQVVENQQHGNDNMDDTSNRDGNGNGNGKKGKKRGRDILEHRNITQYEHGRFREDPVAFMLSVGAFYQGSGWRSHKNYIGARYFYEGYTTEMKNSVLKSKRVQECITQLAERQAELLNQTNTVAVSPTDARKRKKQQVALERELEAVARGIADKCFAQMDSIRLLRLFAFTINTVLVRLYHQGIHIKESEIAVLRDVALEAARTHRSLILLPSHKSHVDYLVISYIFFRLGIALPHIAAGDNLDIPVVGGILKGCGAFFIRRVWGDDQMYKAVVDEYIETLLQKGHNIECFIEGTRSRTGKLLTPKFGLLKMILETILGGGAHDAIIVPISIGYDKVIETSTYMNELLGNPKERESLWAMLTNTRVLQLKWGSIDVRVAKPWSLHDWIHDQIETRRPFNPEHNREHKTILLKSLGYRVLSDINAVSVVMPTALIGTVILTLRGRGVGRNELIRRVDWLRHQITAKGGHVAEFNGMSTGEIVDRSIAILKDLVGERKEKEVIEPTYYGVKRFELSFYRNQVIHLFIEEAIVSAALYTVVKRGGAKSTQRMSFQHLLEEVTFLSSLLKVDFIYKPGNVQQNTERTVFWLEQNQVLARDEEGYIGLSDLERACGRENYVWPFIETYWLAAVSLYSMNPQPTKRRPATHISDGEPDFDPTAANWIDEGTFTRRAQALGKTLYFQGDLSYLEAVNKETLKNAFIRLEEQRIIMVRRGGSNKESYQWALHPVWAPEQRNGHIVPAGKLWDMVEKIGGFRREGKNRRDNATVSTRVLRLAELASHPDAYARSQTYPSLPAKDPKTLATVTAHVGAMTVAKL